MSELKKITINNHEYEIYHNSENPIYCFVTRKDLFAQMRNRALGLGHGLHVKSMPDGVILHLIGIKSMAVTK